MVPGGGESKRINVQQPLERPMGVLTRERCDPEPRMLAVLVLGSGLAVGQQFAAPSLARVAVCHSVSLPFP